MNIPSSPCPHTNAMTTEMIARLNGLWCEYRKAETLLNAASIINAKDNLFTTGYLMLMDDFTDADEKIKRITKDLALTAVDLHNARLQSKQWFSRGR